MKRVRGCRISEKTLKSWDEKLVPAFDLFYFKEKPDYIKIEEIDETRNNFNLDTRTSFETWSVSEDANYMSILSNEDFLRLDQEHQEEIVHQQWLLKRGMVFGKRLFRELLGEYHESVDNFLSTRLKTEEEILLLQKYVWKQLSIEARTTFLLNYAALWTDEIASVGQEQFVETTFPYLAPYVNHFPSCNGPNCFAAVAAAVTENIAYIIEWMQTDTFLHVLRENDFVQIEKAGMKKHDVIVWFTKQGDPVHAAFMLGDELVFNKHGQTMFNPWQIVDITDLLAVWSDEDFQLRIYRKMDVV